VIERPLSRCLLSLSGHSFQNAEFTCRVIIGYPCRASLQDFIHFCLARATNMTRVPTHVQDRNTRNSRQIWPLASSLPPARKHLTLPILNTNAMNNSPQRPHKPRKTGPSPLKTFIEFQPAEIGVQRKHMTPLAQNVLSSCHHPKFLPRITRLLFASGSWQPTNALGWPHHWGLGCIVEAGMLHLGGYMRQVLSDPSQSHPTV
jgi:hypothetical protein